MTWQVSHAREHGLNQGQSIEHMDIEVTCEHPANVISFL